MPNRNKTFWIELLLMLIISGAMYLLFINRFGYYNDDWYSMYAARVEGSQIFHQMYGIDRPGRAYVMRPLYDLFQGDPLYYNLSAFVFRVLGAVCLLWLLRLIWPRRNRETFLIALFFLIYPGFLSMPNAIDFQSHLIGVTLAFISISLGILAIKEKARAHGVLLSLGALLTGWAYLSQMEYYIGFEAVRLVLIGLLAWRENPGWRKWAAHALRTWLPFSAIPALFLIWRLFLFQGERVTTDASVQLGRLVSAPLTTLYAWITNFIQSSFNVVLLAWGVPLSQSFNLDASNRIRGILLGLITAAVVLIAIRYLDRGASRSARSSEHWREEMLVTGLVWTALGLIVVTLANRSVTFPDFSRYGLVSAAGAIMALVSAVSYISEKRVQSALLVLLVFSAAFTHYANGLRFAQQTDSLREFWWQVAWRVPQFQQGASLIVRYPNSGLREDSFVWGPANHIYYPYKVSHNKIQAGIFAILLDQDAVIKILTNEGQIYRKHIIVDTYRNYRHLVILTQPGGGSCVQVIDGTSPEYSSSEAESILTIGAHSEVELIMTDEDFKTPPQFLFGSEPEHGWCFYYEKAALARQRGDWDAVIEIGEQAFAGGLEPKDAIEWMPFLQAFAVQGDVDRLREIALEIAEDRFVVLQACRILSEMTELSRATRETIETLFCD
ncbi:MAG: hypothetical protein ACRDFQ_06655 [Anaerolineales bacterium]